jgi:hypothetical protein
MMLKQTKDATDRDLALDFNGPYVGLGAYTDAIFNHDETLRMSWSLSLRVAESVSISDPAAGRPKVFVKSHLLTVNSQVRLGPLGPRSTLLSYRVGEDQTFSLTPRRSENAGFDLKAEGGDFRFVRTTGRPWQLPGPIKSYAFPDQARTYFQNASFLADLERVYEAQMDSIFYLGPLREYPKREYGWARSRPRDVGIKGEKVVDAILAATVAGERHNLQRKGRTKSFQEIVAYWLQRLRLIHSFKIKELAPGSNYYQAMVRSREGGPEVALTDVGFGVSQVLPIVVLMYYVPEGSTVVLEQPEIHLHPSAQAELADLLWGVACHRNVQVILETHSEHLLLRLQRRVAENSLSAEKLRIYYSHAEGKKSTLVDLAMDELGQLQTWPEQFMGDAFGETAAAEKARLKRLIRG